MVSTMQELAPGNSVQLKKSEDGSGRGAATVAAVASRLYKKKWNLLHFWIACFDLMISIF